jgi:hypothetical protein
VQQRRLRAEQPAYTHSGYDCRNHEDYQEASNPFSFHVSFQAQPTNNHNMPNEKIVQKPLPAGCASRSPGSHSLQPVGVSLLAGRLLIGHFACKEQSQKQETGL